MHHFSSHIIVKNCSTHNLKKISCAIPKNQIIVITGISGSGKSSLAFDTIFVEGQRRYFAHLSQRFHALIQHFPQPEVEAIEGLTPTLAMGQRRHDPTAKSTVATDLEIYDLLVLLVIRCGVQHHPVTGRPLIRYTRTEIVEKLFETFPEGTRIQLIAPVKGEGDLLTTYEQLQGRGFVRFRHKGFEWTSDASPPPLDTGPLEVVIDRITLSEAQRERLASSVEMGMNLSQGTLRVQEGRDGPILSFSELYVCPDTGLSFPPLKRSDFNAHLAQSSCERCKGKGTVIFCDPTALDQDRSLVEQLTLLLKPLPKRLYAHFFVALAEVLRSHHLPATTPFGSYPSSVRQAVLEGSDALVRITSVDGTDIQGRWKGVIPLLQELLLSPEARSLLRESPLLHWQPCPDCRGGQLRPLPLACLFQGKNITELCAYDAASLLAAMDSWSLPSHLQPIGEELLPKLRLRLEMLVQVGLYYLELHRPSSSLSDGEIQRLRLATQLSTKMTGLTYILDEPSRALHKRDIHRLKTLLQSMRDAGNTVILVEHDSSLIAAADHVIELGPRAGALGGEIVFQGTYSALLKTQTISALWLSHRKQFPSPKKRGVPKEWLKIVHANHHTLKNITTKIPLHRLTVLCGVSGSGKSTLAFDVLGQEIGQFLQDRSSPPHLEGVGQIRSLVVAQTKGEKFPPRSMPATLVHLMTPLRQLFAETRFARARGYLASRFSLNRREGRCAMCDGIGTLTVDMHLFSDLTLPCEACCGKRFNEETLKATWEGLSIADVLSMRVEEAMERFSHHPTMSPTLRLMQTFGLGYLTLGQPLETLSGGEIQRLRLIADLATPKKEHTVYIFDEPTSGLHLEDIDQLIRVLYALVDEGHTVIAIEHHLDLIRAADWVVELGPEGGLGGGHLLFSGAPNKLPACTPTGAMLCNV